ncbi:hypothetical protein FF38_08998 [Lucilia cuprina]|uniref:Uncharacterized protein n=1 Tax=Lucilia cuprina TaxID=7375 RepID=A0A0L0CNA5_LUCCU|nr:hypothetical protein FF38_08998 [Lucilia cuprina]
MHLWDDDKLELRVLAASSSDRMDDKSEITPMCFHAQQFGGKLGKSEASSFAGKITIKTLSLCFNPGTLDESQNVSGLNHVNFQLFKDCIEAQQNLYLPGTLDDLQNVSGLNHVNFQLFKDCVEAQQNLYLPGLEKKGSQLNNMSGSHGFTQLRSRCDALVALETRDNILSLVASGSTFFPFKSCDNILSLSQAQDKSFQENAKDTFDNNSL